MKRLNMKGNRKEMRVKGVWEKRLQGGRKVGKDGKRD